MSKTLTLEEAHHRLIPLLNQQVHQPKIGHGSFLTLELGAIHDYYPRTGNPKYEWLIWLYHCNWRLERNNRFVTGCEDSRKNMANIEMLKDKRLLSLDISPLLDLQIMFERDCCLRAFRHSGEDTDHWLIYTPDGSVLTAQGDTLLCTSVQEGLSLMEENYFGGLMSNGIALFISP